MSFHAVLNHSLQDRCGQKSRSRAECALKHYNSMVRFHNPKHNELIITGAETSVTGHSPVLRRAYSPEQV